MKGNANYSSKGGTIKGGSIIKGRGLIKGGIGRGSAPPSTTPLIST